MQTVTVYRDRAEIIRTAAFSTDKPGEHELKITDLSESLDPESIRIKGICGCQILEVSHELVRVDDSKIANEPLRELKLKVSELEKRQKLLTQQKQRLKDQQRYIEKYTESMLYGATSAKEVSPSKLPVAEATGILSFNFTEMCALDEKVNQLDEDAIKINEEISMLRAEMVKCSSSAHNDANNTYTVAVLLDVGAAGEVSIQLTYVVSNSTWRPSYDIRVSTITNVMDITYYADVTQCTGETWQDCEMFLSTSNPSIGSAPPPLPTRCVDWSYNISRRRGSMNAISAASHSSKLKKARKHSSRRENDSDDGDYRERRGSFSLMENGGDALSNRYQQIQSITNILPTAPPMPNYGGSDNVMLSDVAGSGEAGATTFTIRRKVTTASDSKPHKVTVASESFSPQMVHYVAPNIEATAYLQAKVTNTSRYPLLASDKVSVFMDGNFITTTTMRLVSPGESFNIFLGVDPALKVEYRPCRTSSSTKGLFASTEVKHYEYCTVLRNTKQNLCRVIVAEILPRSSDEEIVVELLDPQPAALSKLGDGKSVSVDQDIISSLDSIAEGGAAWPADFVTQNKVTNNVVWLKTIAAGDKVTLSFNYRLLWPKGKTVDIL